MAFEINEIGIHMQIGENGASRNGVSGAAAQGCEEGQTEDSAQNDLVEQCVRRVLRILKSEQER